MSTEIPKYIASPDNQTENVDKTIDYADISKSLEENMQNLLKNSEINTSKIENNNLYRKEKELCWIECKDKSENNELFTVWLTQIFDSYLEKQV